MDLLQQYLGNIRVPKPDDKVYKDECVYSFDSPETEDGLYISLTSFVGVGREYLEMYYNSSGDAVYLHIKRDKKVICEKQCEGPERKITRLAIGVEGGFPSDSEYKVQFTDHCNIVVLPSFASISWPNEALPTIVKSSVQGIFESQSVNKKAELEALHGTWDGEVRVVSKYADNLEQLNNGKKILPSGWQCEKCDKTDNLWLNLSDGTILCGRKFYDGSGGNNHAVEHYSSTGYPLAVKLGTITEEGKGDVYSYVEDDMVEDPKLIQHLAHWGINIANMEKTEKSMLELELELNQKTDEWLTLTEKHGNLEPLYGSGFTGMVNMGNSCYLNSVMQMLFSITDFVQVYYEDRELILCQSEGTHADNFNVQMSKLGHGLLSGRYSKPPSSCDTQVDTEQTGICPIMFRNLVGRGHPEFSTKKQQDAQEFFLHIISLLERNSKNSINPGKCFEFQIEEKYQCTVTKKVKYLTRSDVLLPLTIPEEFVTNKTEVLLYEELKKEMESKGQPLDPSLLVRKKIKFGSCLDMFLSPELIHNFYSTAAEKMVTARKTTRLSTFPDYLVIQLKKFMLREDWVPIKLDVSIEMPDEIDFASLRGNGLQENEELLPELDTPIPMPAMDENILRALADMGFPPDSCKRAVCNTQNSGIEAATAWIMEHIGDSDFSDPFIPPGAETVKFNADPVALATIISMGFTEDQASKALKATENNVERAMDWIFSHQNELNETQNTTPFRDGNTKYKLVAFISHMGTSTTAGHYVVHILKEEGWVIYNDNKVALSRNPPKDLGYMYLYQRM